MGCARESLDLLSRRGRRSFMKSIRFPISVALKDTFGHFVCSIIGHCILHSYDWGHDWFCNRCGRYMEPPNNYVVRPDMIDSAGILKNALIDISKIMNKDTGVDE